MIRITPPNNYLRQPREYASPKRFRQPPMKRGPKPKDVLKVRK